MASRRDSNVLRGTKRKHNTISIQDKVDVLKKLDCGVPVRHLCATYSIGRTTVIDIKRQKEKILQFYTNSDSKKQMSFRKTMKDVKSTEHDRIMLEWYKQRKSDGFNLSSSMFKEQAKLFHEELKLEYKYDYNNGWLSRFKKRHGIAIQKMCGQKEKQSINEERVDKFVQFSNLVTNENIRCIRVSKEKQDVHDFLEYATEPVTKHIVNNSENQVEWMQTENNNKTPVVSHSCTYEKITDSVINHNSEEGGDKDDADVSGKLTIDKLIELLTELIDGLESLFFVTKQELINFYLMHEKLHRERSKYT